MSAVYQINRRCCATCRFWDGDRRPEFRANRLFYVKVLGSAASCASRPNDTSPVNYCPRWMIDPSLEP